jgi:hypothetical protein
MLNISDLDLNAVAAYATHVLRELCSLEKYLESERYLESQAYTEASDVEHAQAFHHLASFIRRELAQCPNAASRFEMTSLGSKTRNLFEVMFIVEFVCASADNMARFVADAVLDDLEIMNALTSIERKDPKYMPDEKVEARRSRLEERVHQLGLSGKRPLMRDHFARAVNRETQYKELQSFYSKLSHATAWAIIGGTQESVRWEVLAKYMLLKAAQYASKCCRLIREKTGFSPNRESTEHSGSSD